MVDGSVAISLQNVNLYTFMLLECDSRDVALPTGLQVDLKHVGEIYRLLHVV